ncbi:MAG: hypothetical protein IPO18_02495 [bacterium]|nr:hypothetical protein [bacterium]
MKKLLTFGILLLLMMPGAGCNVDRAAAPESTVMTDAQSADPALLAADILHQAGWEPAEDQVVPEPSGGKCIGLVTFVDRTEVAPGIAHYFWTVRVGPAPEDRIGLHRVVRETRPRVPARTQLSVFLQHGDAKNFVGMFLPGTISASTPDDFGAAVYWARAGVDVWGIDQAWNLVPAATSDFAFMADWGLDKQYKDLGLAVTLARTVRLLTGNGFDKMNLLGYSSGSATGYALINAETQLPPGRRQVGGWIPVDYSPITDDDEWNTIQNCDYIPFYQGLVDSGDYGYFVGFDYLGNLARDDPDGESPVLAGLTNLQAAIYFGAGPIFNVGGIHYLAGTWENELPVDLVHVTVGQWLDFMVAGAPWEPARFILDYAIWGCREQDMPWDDHFGEITLPVLNVAAAGGIGPTTYDCLALLGSSDITNLTVQLLPDDQALYDFGHIDLWIARESPELVWQPILDWLVDHRVRGHGNPHMQ